MPRRLFFSWWLATSPLVSRAQMAQAVPVDSAPAQAILAQAARQPPFVLLRS